MLECFKPPISILCRYTDSFYSSPTTKLSSAFSYIFFSPKSPLLDLLNFESSSFFLLLLQNSFSSVSRLELCFSLHLLFEYSTQSDGSGTRCSVRQHDEAKEGSAEARASEGGHSQVRDPGRGFHGALRCALYVISTKHIMALQQQLK
jgi:hypothetical protein